MNYGYDSTDPLWKDDRKFILASRLRDAIPLGGRIEVDGLLPGVRIRGLTNLDDNGIRLIVDLADSIFVEVMTNNLTDR